MLKWKMHHHCKKIQSQNVQIFGYVHQTTNGPNHGPAWETQSFLLSEIWTVILWQDHYGKGKFEKVLSAHSWEQVPDGEYLFVHREKGLFLSVYVDQIKQAGRKQNIDPMWKVLMKEDDLGEPTSFLDQVYLGCTQRECQTSKDTVDNNHRDMFESKIFARATEKVTLV